MPSQPDPAPHPWRRFLRFSVRGLIVFVIAVGAGLGWTVREAQIQRAAVGAIKNAGGSIRYDWEWKDGNPIPGGEPWAPRWLVNLIGVDYFGHVTGAVSHHMSAATSDAVIAQVGRLTGIQSLNLHDSSMSDSGLVHLDGLSKLSALDLNGTQVTDAGLAHLTGLTKLSELYLRYTLVTDAGVKELEQSLPNLRIFR